MKKTKIISLAASAVLVFALTGCQNTAVSSIPTVDIGDGQSNSTQSAPVSSTTSSGISTTENSGESSVTSDESSASTGQPNNPNGGGLGERSGSVIVTGDGRGIPIFGGGSGTTYAESLNEIKLAVGNQVNVFSMIVPTQGSFYMPDGFTMANEWDCIANVNEQLYGIIPVDAYSALAAHIDEEIYARTDHHWMQLGAYYAAEEFVKTAQISVPFAPLSDYAKFEVEGYLGSLYGSSNDNATMGSNPETFTYYIPQNDFATYYMNPEDTEFTQGYMFVEQDVSQSYCRFMGGDMKIVHVETDVKNSRKLLIIKDSYPNAMVPCLTGSFEEIWTADVRYLDDIQNFPHSISQIVKDQGITDVLFCMNTFSAVGENADNLPAIV